MGATKSRRERIVVVSEEMGAVLRKWKAQRAEERLAFGPAYRDDGWICAEADGSLVRPDTLTARFRALEKRAGVPHRGLHACTHARHTGPREWRPAGRRVQATRAQLSRDHGGSVRPPRRRGSGG